MSSAGTRSRNLLQKVPIGSAITAGEWVAAKGVMSSGGTESRVMGSQTTTSESHPRGRDGSYREGGPFYTSRVVDFIQADHRSNVNFPSLNKVYSGPCYGNPPTLAEMKEIGYSNIERKYGSSNEEGMKSDGTTAISLCNPVNPASDLGTTLAESVREGVPSLPGIKLWRDKTQFLKGLGSEYLNYQFGWAPLQHEVNSVVSAARNHRDLLSQYHRGEGSDTHRTFRFPSSYFRKTLPVTTPNNWHMAGTWTEKHGTRQVSLVRETHRWFEGVFTYALPSSTDSWRRALGFGSDADRLFGLTLSPDVLWELTPWSWAVDWFTNVGDVINNVTNFGLAGLVMRYGYMMEESIETVTAEGGTPIVDCLSYEPRPGSPGFRVNHENSSSGTWACGTSSVTKRRVPASPFGFSIGWEGLSPTQLAITAALGITRLL